MTGRLAKRHVAIISSTLLACAAMAAEPGTVPASAAATTPHPARAENSAPETSEKRDARMQWWREARFGMFIHWGPYAVPAGAWQGPQGTNDGHWSRGVSEWLMYGYRIPVDAYATLAPKFNPVKFDADAWVRLAKDAGMRYIVITAKHHDGFAMFPSKASRFNIMDATPFKRDPLAELAAACRKHAIKLGFYYSQAQDWHHPGGATWDNRPKWDPNQEGSMAEYIRTIAVPQVRELLTHYGEFPSILWWDTPSGMTREMADQLLALTTRRPDLIMNNRLGGGIPGDTDTPEQTIPPNGIPGRDWETCMTMNGAWGFNANDHHWKSTRDLIINLCDIASKGGNYLLNVGPTAEGIIPAPSIERLQAIGAWLRTNGESIYGTTATPFTQRLRWGRCTRKGQHLYLHLMDVPESRRITLPLRGEVISACMLDDQSERITYSRTDAGWELSVPKADAGRIRVVKVTVQGGIDEIIPVVAKDPDAKLVIYDDALTSGWGPNGWGGTLDPACSTPVRSGQASMAITLEAGGGQGILNLSGINTEPYRALSFWVHGGAAGGQVLTLQFCRGMNVAAVRNLDPLPANEWKHILVPLDAVSLNNVEDFTCLRFVDTPNAAPPVFYVDDLQLIGTGAEAKASSAETGKTPPGTRQRVVDLPLQSQVWPSQPPKDCPFEQSKALAGIMFSGAHSDYRAGDTFYPSWASDGNQYSPFTDGVTDGVGSFSFGEKATTGNAVMIGDDPLNLKIKNTAPPQVANPRPYEGRYPAGSLVYNGVWYYGTYCLGPSGTVQHEGFTYNWPVLGPMPGFRISKDYGKTWTPSPLSPDKPLFPEPAKFMGPVKMGAPHFVDFGKNMEHSPDGKAYLLGMGAEENDPKPRYANLSWISADQVYLARVTPSPETINDPKAYEFFAGHDSGGKPLWTDDFARIKPLLDWNNNMGCVTATYLPGRKKYLMCVTDGWPTCAKMNSYILEADQLTGPWRLVVYMKDFGEQAYFLNFPSKFISPDGKNLWLCYSANFAADWNGMKLKFNPPGGRYGLCLHEVRLLAPGEKVEEKANPFAAPDNVARQAKIETCPTHPDYRAEGAIDGQAGGWPDDIKHEWASFGWGEGAWIKLTWEKPQTVSRVWLVDRPNPTDQITGGTIQFSDGTSVDIYEPLPDDGTKALEITFQPKTITSLTFKVTKVKQTPCNVGLSEIAVFAKGSQDNTGSKK